MNVRRANVNILTYALNIKKSIYSLNYIQYLSGLRQQMSNLRTRFLKERLPVQDTVIKTHGMLQDLLIVAFALPSDSL